MPRKSSKRRKSASSAPGHQTADSPDRRAALRRIATYGVGGAVVLGGGGAFAMDFRKKLIEHDLSVIGQGTPVVLQIHDPQCPMCNALQKQTRKALRAFDGKDVLYRVANIRTDDGAALQAREGLPHVTLVLYCGRGERLHVIQGVTEAETLIAAFEEHLRLQQA